MEVTTELERNSSVSCLHYLILAFVDDLQTREFGSGFFADHQNVIIADGAFESCYSPDLDTVMQAATELKQNLQNPAVSCLRYLTLAFVDDDPQTQPEDFDPGFFAEHQSIFITGGAFENRFLPDSDSIMQAATELERNSSVSCLHY